jgi:rubrerythrin
MKLMGVLDEAIELEEKIRSCYELLSRLTEDGTSAELKQLAREEKSHANVLKTGKDFVVRTPDLFGQETISDTKIRLGLKAVADLEENLIGRKTDFPQGLKKLYGLEKKFEKVHMNTAVEFKDFSLKKLFEALARADAEHRQRLERLIAQL